MNRIGSILLWLVGEILLIAGFLNLGQNDVQSHLILNMSVSSIILTVYIVSLFGKNERSFKKGVGKGMRWFFTLNYSLLSIAAMVYFGFFNSVDVTTQLIVQLILLAVLCMGMWGAFNPSKKTESDTKYLKMEQNQLIMIRNVINVVRLRAERRKELPTSLLNEIKELQDEASQISPGNEYVALKMEGRIMNEMNQINASLNEQTLDLQRLKYIIKNCSKLISEYRRTYSMAQMQQYT